MSVKVVLDIKQVEKDIDIKLEDGMMKTTVLLLHEIEHGQYLPRRSGDLAKSRTIEKDWKNNSIYMVWNTKYAAKVYFGTQYKFRKQFHKNARALWDKPVLGNRENVSQAIKRSFKND